MRIRTQILLYYQGSSTEGSARATTADEAHLFHKDLATTHKVCIVNLACQGYSFSSVWTPPTIFNTRLALPHLGRNINTDCIQDHPTRSKLLDCACNLPTVCGRHSGCNNCNILARFPDPLACQKKVVRGTWPVLSLMAKVIKNNHFF